MIQQGSPLNRLYLIYVSSTVFYGLFQDTFYRWFLGNDNPFGVLLSFKGSCGANAKSNAIFHIILGCIAFYATRAKKKYTIKIGAKGNGIYTICSLNVTLCFVSKEGISFRRLSPHKNKKDSFGY